MISGASVLILSSLGEAPPYVLRSVLAHYTYLDDVVSSNSFDVGEVTNSVQPHSRQLGREEEFQLSALTPNCFLPLLQCCCICAQPHAGCPLAANWGHVEPDGTPVLPPDLTRQLGPEQRHAWMAHPPAYFGSWSLVQCQAIHGRDSRLARQGRCGWALARCDRAPADTVTKGRAVPALGSLHHSSNSNEPAWSS
jgi:hypothetical protein